MYLSICLSVCLSIYLSLYLSISVCTMFIHVDIYIYIHMYVLYVYIKKQVVSGTHLQAHPDRTALQLFVGHATRTRSLRAQRASAYAVKHGPVHSFCGSSHATKFKRRRPKKKTKGKLTAILVGPA